MTSPAALDRVTIEGARALFRPVPGYLNAASLGLPPRTVTETLKLAIDEWSAGETSPTSYDQHVARSRDLFARLVDVPTSHVAVASQVSVLAGTVAASLPDGAEVICVEGDFSSMVFPFLVHADRGVTVRHVPIDAVAEAVRPTTVLVAFSLVQSACGSVVDAEAVREAAAGHGAVTFCDLTQAAGWMPVGAGGFDITACSAYKWLCAPRCSAFLTVAPDLEERLPLRPVNAGWYAGDSVWDSCYGPGMHLAHDARRFDVSPAWLPWAGTVPALELFTSLDMHAVRDWDVRVANAFRAGLGLEAADRPVVSLPDPDGAKQAALSAAGAVVAGRAGKVRIAFHLWNDESDVDLALNALAANRS